MFWNRKKRKPVTIPDVEDLDQRILPILNASELINLLQLHNRLRNIRRLTTVSSEDFERLYQPALDRFMESAQLIPASSSYHHTAPGGLIQHTLAVIEYALSERNAHILPELSDVETQAKEKHIWTYAVFAAAILHDAGKLLTQQTLKLSTNTSFNIFDGISNLSNDTTYHLEFNNYFGSYRLHQQISSIFFCYFIPTIAQSWLSSNLTILDELTACIQGNNEFSPSIAKIIQSADSKSVAENIGMTKSKRFLGATPPLSEKIMICLRYIASNFGLNKPGAGMFKKDGITWIVSNRLATDVKEWLKSQEESVPHDNNRIFDELEYSGFALRGESGIVQWIKVTLNEWSTTLSVIGFDSKRIFSSLPQDFEGEIVVTTSAPAHSGSATSTTASTKILPVSTKHESSTANINNFTSESAINLAQLAELGFDTESDSDTTDADVWGDPILPGSVIDNSSTDMQSDSDINPPAPVQPNLDQVVLPDHAYNEKTFVPFDPALLPPFPNDEVINSEKTGHLFIEWLKVMIKHRRWEVNENDSPIHKIDTKNDLQVLAIMSPMIFIYFCKDYNLVSENGKNLNNQVRNGIKKSGFLLSHANKKKEIFSCSVKDKPFKMFFCLIEERHLVEYGVSFKINDSLILDDLPCLE